MNKVSFCVIAILFSASICWAEDSVLSEYVETHSQPQPEPSSAADEEDRPATDSRDAARQEIIYGFFGSLANRHMAKSKEYLRHDSLMTDLIYRRFFTKNFALEFRPQYYSYSLYDTREFVNQSGINDLRTIRLRLSPFFQFYGKKWLVDLDPGLAADYAQEMGFRNSLIFNPLVSARLPWVGLQAEFIGHIGKPLEYHNVVRGAADLYIADWLIGVGLRAYWIFWPQIDQSSYQSQFGPAITLLLPKKKIHYEGGGLTSEMVFDRKYLGWTFRSGIWFPI